MLSYVRTHKKLSSLIFIVLIAVIGLAATGTLTYPYIMLARQVQMIRYCVFGDNFFSTADFQFSFAAPKGYCFLPHRLFPRDGSIQVIPQGWYFVLNEYTQGSIVQASQATLLFEPIVPGRSTAEVLAALVRGGFLTDAKISTSTNPAGLALTVVEHARGLQSDTYYDWAFVTNPTKPILLSVLSAHPENPTVFKYLLDQLQVQP